MICLAELTEIMSRTRSIRIYRIIERGREERTHEAKETRTEEKNKNIKGETETRTEPEDKKTKK